MLCVCVSTHGRYMYSMSHRSWSGPDRRMSRRSTRPTSLHLLRSNPPGAVSARRSAGHAARSACVHVRVPVSIQFHAARKCERSRSRCVPRAPRQSVARDQTHRPPAIANSRDTGTHGVEQHKRSGGGGTTAVCSPRWYGMLETLLLSFARSYQPICRQRPALVSCKYPWHAWLQ